MMKLFQHVLQMSELPFTLIFCGLFTLLQLIMHPFLYVDLSRKKEKGLLLSDHWIIKSSSKTIGI